MNVEEAVSKVLEMPANSVIVAKPPFTWGSEALFVDLTADHGIPESVRDAGYEYVIEREELVELLAFLRTKKVGRRTRAEFVIHYALMDCAPAWIDDIPNV